MEVLLYEKERIKIFETNAGGASYSRYFIHSSADELCAGRTGQQHGVGTIRGRSSGDRTCGGGTVQYI